jgi:hypothetical protein
MEDTAIVFKIIISAGFASFLKKIKYLNILSEEKVFWHYNRQNY